MAKYIIDIPDDTTYLNALRFKDGKYVSTRSYIIPDLTPYVRSESYIDGLKDGQNDAWKFARKMISTSGNEMSEMWGCATNFGEVMHNTTYSEAKAKYDAWKREKEEIHIGDEVTAKTDTDKDMPKGIVTYNNPEQSQFLVIKSDGTFSWWHKGGLRKTGRHFDEVEKLLERMREE